MPNRLRSLRPILLALLIIAIAGLAVPALSAQGAASRRAWYADRLEKLGFVVFSKPEALDEYAVTSLGGAAGKLGDQKGKIVLLNFWATWCPPCRAEMPAIDALWKKTKGAAFAIMGVSVGEEPSQVKDFIAKQGFGYPIYVDPTGELGAAFGARSIPTTYVLDKSGAAIAGKVGGAPYDSPEAIALFSELASR
jgi:thiol-disulfide isomerase/thioredoxin